MLLDGKLGRRREPICALGGLVYLQDANSKQNFLVDTGAAVSVFLHKSNSPSTGPPLAGADGKPIPSWGRVKKSLTFGFRTFLCSFILAAVSKPILGVDFLSANRLLVDSSTRQVLESDSLRPLTPPPADTPTKSRRGTLPCGTRSPCTHFFFSRHYRRRVWHSSPKTRSPPLHRNFRTSRFLESPPLGSGKTPDCGSGIPQT
jgi:hypothetical protein